MLGIKFGGCVHRETLAKELQGHKASVWLPRGPDQVDMQNGRVRDLFCVRISKYVQGEMPNVGRRLSIMTCMQGMLDGVFHGSVATSRVMGGRLVFRMREVAETKMRGNRARAPHPRQSQSGSRVVITAAACATRLSLQNISGWIAVPGF